MKKHILVLDEHTHMHKSLTFLVLAGFGRFVIEFFRPDQPHLGTTCLSFTQIATLIMMLVGLFMLAARFQRVNFTRSFLPDKYQLTTTRP